MKRIIALILCFVFISFPSFAATMPSTWAEEEVKTAISLGLVPDELQGNYTSPITRAEFSALIIRLANVWALEGKTSALSVRVPELNRSVFSDTIDVNVLYCAALGIVEGDGKGHFMPDNPIQRQQAAKILYKTEDVFTLVTVEDDLHTTQYRGYSSHEMPHIFDDSALLGSWSRTAVNWCYRHGIMQGVGNSSFDPSGTYTREQSIMTILRLYYSNGMADKLSMPGLDYYPVYHDSTMTSISYWIDSSLVNNSVEEIGYIGSNEKYAFVNDYGSLGSSYGHVINKSGVHLLIGLYGTEGYFSFGIVNGNLIELHIKLDLPHTEDAPYYFVIDMESGKIYENTTLDKLIPTEDKNSACTVVSEKTGYYALYGLTGRKLSKTYLNALVKVNDTLFLGWVSDYPRIYDVIYCDGNSEAIVLRTEEFRFNTSVYSDGGGIYAVQNTDTKVTLFDAFGVTISEIKSDIPITLLGFANGLIVAEAQSNGEIKYYTQNGKPLPVFLSAK
jgi:hypothetical protein